MARFKRVAVALMAAESLLFSQSGADQVSFKTTGGTVFTNVGAVLNSGYLFDSGYSTFTAACSAANSNSKTLLITRNWTIGTGTYACAKWFLQSGMLTVSASATATPTGSITAPATQRIFNTSASSAVVNLSVDSAAEMYPNWWGIGNANDDTATNAAMVQAARTGIPLRFVSNSALKNITIPNPTRNGMTIFSNDGVVLTFANSDGTDAIAMTTITGTPTLDFNFPTITGPDSWSAGCPGGSSSGHGINIGGSGTAKLFLRAVYVQNFCGTNKSAIKLGNVNGTVHDTHARYSYTGIDLGSAGGVPVIALKLDSNQFTDNAQYNLKGVGVGNITSINSQYQSGQKYNIYCDGCNSFSFSGVSHIENGNIGNTIVPADCDVVFDSVTGNTFDIDMGGGTISSGSHAGVCFLETGHGTYSTRYINIDGLHAIAATGGLQADQYAAAYMNIKAYYGNYKAGAGAPFNASDALILPSDSFISAGSNGAGACAGNISLGMRSTAGPVSGSGFGLDYDGSNVYLCHNGSVIATITSTRLTLPNNKKFNVTSTGGGYQIDNTDVINSGRVGTFAAGTTINSTVPVVSVTGPSACPGGQHYQTITSSFNAGTGALTLTGTCN